MEIIIFCAIVWLIGEAIDIRKTLKSIDSSMSYIRESIREAKEEK